MSLIIINKDTRPIHQQILPGSIESCKEKITNEIFRHSIETAKFEIRTLSPFGPRWNEHGITRVSTRSPSVNDPRFLTPPLTGKYPVGVRFYSTNCPRQLLIDVHYPGNARNTPVYRFHPLSTGTHPLNVEKISDSLIKSKMSNLWTRSEPGITPVLGENFPVIFFSHGNSTNHFDYQGIVEELASNGYCVITISHPSSNNSSAFAKLNPPYDPPPTNHQFMSAIMEQTKDVQSVLGQIRNAGIEGFDSVFGASINAGILGHSLGGGTALQTCRQTPLIRAGIDLDGAVLREVDKGIAIKQPFLTIAAGKGGSWNQGGQDYLDWQKYHAKSPRSKKILFEEADHMDFALDPLFNAKMNNKKNSAHLELNCKVNKAISFFFNKHLKK